MMGDGDAEEVGHVGGPGAAAPEHMTIGEVLALLQPEFPDVTISKIRFLESQGLIQPERTASGYRRFTASDLERLQWILLQQRENFLPLKVIRKMLDAGVDHQDPPGASQQTLFASSVQVAAEEALAEEARDHGDLPDAGADDDGGDDGDSEGGAPSRPRRSPAHPAVAAASSSRPSPQPQPRPSDAPTRDARDDATEDRASGVSGSDDERTEDSATEDRATGGSAGPDTGSGGGTRRGSARPGSAIGEGSTDDGRAGRASDSGRSSASARRPPHETPADVVAALQEAPGAVSRRDARRDTDRARRRPSPPQLADEGSRITADELCAAVDIDPGLLADLERFGLLRSQSGRGGERTYGPDAVHVGRLAARYAELGLEPRHLRMYLVAAEREAGMLEQVAVPLLKQRNPRAREHASELACELAELGADLHRALLRRELGPDLFP